MVTGLHFCAARKQRLWTTIVCRAGFGLLGEAVMSCKRCTSEVKDFNGELGIHFPGLEGLDKPIVWVFPKLTVCLACGFAEFVVPDEPLEQLRNCVPAQSRESARAS